MSLVADVAQASGLPTPTQAGGLRYRVLHIVPTLFDDNGEIVGGAERYAFELARHMAHETPTSLVSFGPRERRETIGDLRLRIIAKS